MALIQKQDEVIDENSKLEAVDEKNEDNLQDVDQDEVKERNEDENDEEVEENEENDDADDEAETEEKRRCFKIPIYLSIDKGADEEDEVPNMENGKNGNTKNISDNTKNVKEDTSEREIDIVNIPKLPPLPQESEKTKRPPSRQSAKHSRHYGHSTPPCCGYMDAYCPRPLDGYQGIGHSGFYPFVTPSLGFPVVMMPAFSLLGVYPSVMPQICCAQAMGYRGMGPYPNCSKLENESYVHHCPMGKYLNHYDDNYHHDDHHHSDHRHYHHHGEDQQHHGDHYDEEKPHRHHHHHQDGFEDEDRECQELENCCLQHDANDHEDDCDDDDEDDDETKSVEDLLEEYLEDIDEKTERIHELLDECEAMDLFINVHGFELEEIQVSAYERTVTIKGDHQYTEATWVRVRNFSEGYEIPEEFDISRTTATKTGDTLRIRIPHVDGE